MPVAGQQQQGYDPTNPTPYQAYQPPEGSQPQPSPMAPPNQPFQFSGAPISKLGAVAGVLDNVLRGYMQGKAQHADKVAKEFKTKIENAQASHSQDVQRLDELMAAGVSPTDPQYVQAKNSSEGSWSYLMDLREKVAIGPDGDKKKKSSKKKPDQAQPQQASPFGQPPQSPQQQLQEQKKQQMQQLYQDAQSTDPKVKVAAYWQIQKLMGSPVSYRTKYYESPEYQAQMKAQTENANLSGSVETGDLQHRKSIQDSQGIMDTYNKIPQSQWTEPMKQHYESQKRIVDDSQRRGGGASHLYQSPDKTSQEYYTPGEEPQGWQPAQKPPSESELKRTDYDKAVQGGYKGSFESWTAEQAASGRRAGAPLVGRGAGGSGSRGGGGNIDARFNQWVGYFKKQGLDQAHAEAKAKIKVEGAASVTADAIGKEYSEDPYGFDSDVLKKAMNEVIQDPANGYWDAEKRDAKPWVKDAFANVLGHNEDEDTYQYRHPKDWNVLVPDKKGKYSGDVTKEQVQRMDSQLQNKIQAILLKQKGLTPDEVSESKKRMRSLFGYIPQGSGTTAESPQPAAATPAPGASSPPAASANLPEAARKQLKAGHVTTFGNGQQWTLDDDGQPKQVK